MNEQLLQARTCHYYYIINLHVQLFVGSQNWVQVFDQVSNEVKANLESQQVIVFFLAGHLRKSGPESLALGRSVDAMTMSLVALQLNSCQLVYYC